MKLRLSEAQVDLTTGAVVRKNGTAVRLTDTELGLLRYLALRPGQAVERSELYREVWAYSPRVVSRTLDLTVARIRAKVERDPAAPNHLLTVRGVGYQLLANPESTPEVVDPVRAELPPPPVPADATVGRDVVLERLREAASATRLLTLVGGPGMGKTRLAAEYVRSVAASGQSVMWLGPGRTGDLLATLSAALGASGELREPATALARRLPDGPTLLVIDDADPLTATDREHLLALVRAASDLRVLATARSPLQLTGEGVVEVAPLAVSESEALLAARVGPGSHDPAALRQLAIRLEGVPLALELAAALVRLLGLAATVELLEPSLAALQLASGPHQPGLVAAVERSWNVLSAEERDYLIALTPFRGGFTLASAAGVIGPAAVAAIARLRSRSLLYCTSNDRFTMFDAVREVVVARANPAHAARARTAHAEWFTNWLVRRSEAELAPVLDEELANVEAAVDTLVATDRRADACRMLVRLTWLRLGRSDLTQLMGWAARGLAAAPDAETHATFEAFRARHLSHANRFGEALPLARRAAELAARADAPTRMHALQTLIQCSVLAGEQAEAERTAEALTEVIPGLPIELAMRARIEIARVYSSSAHPEEAVRQMDALEPQLASMSEALLVHAQVVRAFARGVVDPPRAVLELQRLEQWTRERGADSNADSLALARAHLLVRAGRADEATAALSGRHDPGRRPLSELVRAWIAWLNADPACESLLHGALDLARRVGDRYGESLAHAALGQLARRDHQPATALARLDEAMSLHRGHAGSIAGWVAVVRIEQGATRPALDALDPTQTSTHCARWLAGEGPEPLESTLPPGHELVDRIGLDLTLERGRPISPLGAGDTAA